MLPLPAVQYLHLVFAFVYAASLMASHWNVLAARRATSWAERAPLYELNRRLSVMFALPSLIGAGIVGNLLAMMLGLRMGESRTFQVATGLWLVLLVLALAFEMPLSARLATQSRAAAGAEGGERADWNSSLGRWRIGNALQLVVFLVLLAVMVQPWKS